MRTRNPQAFLSDIRMSANSRNEANHAEGSGVATLNEESRNEANEAEWSDVVVWNGKSRNEANHAEGSDVVVWNQESRNEANHAEGSDVAASRDNSRNEAIVAESESSEIRPRIRDTAIPLSPFSALGAFTDVGVCSFEILKGRGST